MHLVLRADVDEFLFPAEQEQAGPRHQPLSQRPQPDEQRIIVDFQQIRLRSKTAQDIPTARDLHRVQVVSSRPLGGLAAPIHNARRNLRPCECLGAIGIQFLPTRCLNSP